MCGIVGIVGSEIDYKAKSMFKDLLIMDTIRGEDSTGMLLVDKDLDVTSYKKAVDGFTFTQMGVVNSMLSRSITPKLFLGHNRAATAGKINNDNAHPFQDGNTHLVHNGTLTAWTQLHNSTLTNVDSEAICFEVEKTGIIDTIPKLNGAFTLATYNDKSNIFSLIRNEQRPLWCAHVKDKDVMIFASLPGFIEVVAQKYKVELDGAPWSLLEHTLISFDLTSKAIISDMSITKDVPAYVPPVSRWEGSNGKKHLPSNKDIKLLGGVIEGNTNVVGLVDKKKKRDAAIAEKLATDFQLLMGEKIVGQVRRFSYFSGQENTLPKGSGYGKMYIGRCNPRDPYSADKLVCFRATHDDFETYKDDYVHCTVIGTVDDKGVGELTHQYLPLVKVEKVLTSDEQLEFWENCDWETVFEEVKEETPNTLVTYLGEEITTEVFNEKVKNGCAVCSDPMFPNDSDGIMEVLGEPICKGCTSSLAWEARITGATIAELITK